MLITISGIVGSGKTTFAHHVSKQLRADGQIVSSLQFQSLPCFRLLRSSRGHSSRATQDTPSGTGPSTTPVRWAGYRRKRLTLVATIVYALRIVAFRIYRLSWAVNHEYVLNRYFYDLFTHYRLESRIEKFYCSILKALIPVPNLAILVIAEPSTISSRRPDYSDEYLSELAKAYAALREQFPELVVIANEPGDRSLQMLEEVIVNARR